jgi:hypothetical protein
MKLHANVALSLNKRRKIAASSALSGSILAWAELDCRGLRATHNVRSAPAIRWVAGALSSANHEPLQLVGGSTIERSTNGTACT